MLPLLQLTVPVNRYSRAQVPGVKCGLSQDAQCSMWFCSINSLLCKVLQSNITKPQLTAWRTHSLHAAGPGVWLGILRRIYSIIKGLTAFIACLPEYAPLQICDQQKIQLKTTQQQQKQQKTERHCKGPVLKHTELHCPSACPIYYPKCTPSLSPIIGTDHCILSLLNPPFCSKEMKWWSQVLQTTCFRLEQLRTHYHCSS